MFDKLQQLDKAFRLVRGFCAVVVLACSLICFGVVWQCKVMVSQAQARIYILANDKALEAVAGERASNLTVEAKDHVKNFHRYFFTLDPDEEVIRSQISKALYLADGSAKQQFDNLKEKGYYRGLIAANISQDITVDSIRVDLARAPYFMRCYATQRIIRATNTVYRSLVTEGWLRPVARSSNNPHGFLLERWVTIHNVDIKTVNR